MQNLVSHPDYPNASPWFSVEEIVRAKVYQLERLRHFFSLKILELTFLIFILGSGWYIYLWNAGHRLTRAVLGNRLPKFKKALIPAFYIIIFMFTFELMRSYESYYGDFLLNQEFQLNNQTISKWLVHRGLNFFIMLPIFLSVFFVLWMSINRFKSKAFIVSGFFVWIGALSIILIAPIVIDPLFHDFKPINSTEKQEDFRELATKSQVNVDEILSVDASKRTQKANAYFTGIGPSKRIVLYDTLLNKFTHEEVKVVLAHELGHWKHAHLLKGACLLLPFFIFISWLVQAIIQYSGAFKNEEPFQKQAILLPVLLIVVLSALIVTTPMINLVSRQFEREADVHALNITQDQQSMNQLMIKLAKNNLTDILPSKMTVLYFNSHPKVLDRLNLRLHFHHYKNARWSQKPF